MAQFQLPVETKAKADKLVEVLRAEAPEQAIVFVRTKVRCEQLFKILRDRGMNARALHGDMSQGSRDGVMLAFKGGRVPILVATDVAARGLDISTVTHVINYDVPTSPDTYVHRIGRTGRVGRSGRAITFVEDRQKRELEAIERHIGTSVAQWTQGAVAAPTPVKERPRRHSKPRISRQDKRSLTSSWCSAGGGRPGFAWPTSSLRSPPRRPRRRGRARRAGARALLIPLRARNEAERVIEALDGQEVRGRELSLQQVGASKFSRPDSMLRPSAMCRQSLMVVFHGHGEASCDIEGRSGIRPGGCAQALADPDRPCRRSRRSRRTAPGSRRSVAAAVGAFATQIGVLGSEEAKRLDREEERDVQDAAVADAGESAPQTLIDASALIALLGAEPAAGEVQKMLNHGVAMTTLNLAEAVDRLKRRYDLGIERTRPVIEGLLVKSLTLVPLGPAQAWRAGEIRAAHYHRSRCPISLADAVLVASAPPGGRIAKLRRAAAARGCERGHRHHPSA